MPLSDPLTSMLATYANNQESARLMRDALTADGWRYAGDVSSTLAGAGVDMRYEPVDDRGWLQEHVRGAWARAEFVAAAKVLGAMPAARWHDVVDTLRWANASPGNTRVMQSMLMLGASADDLIAAAHGT